MYVSVCFPNSPKRYIYKTKLPLIKGAVYDIVADGCTTYSAPVTVDSLNVAKHNVPYVREITEAKLLQAPSRPQSFIEHVQFNEKKGITTVIWCDGIVTMVKCHPEDKFDKEKALAMCFMKRYYNNRGCFNEELKKWCGSEE